jgi:hypothetical protein
MVGSNLSRFETDFIESAGGAPVLLRAYQGGTGGSGISGTTTSAFGGRAAVAFMTAGSAAAYGIGRTHSSIAVGAGAILLETEMYLSADPDGTDDFEAEFGLMTKTDGSAETDGIWFRMPT